MNEYRELLEKSYRHALSESDPADLVASHLPSEAPAAVLAVGKAAMSMLSPALGAFPQAAWLATPPSPAEGDATYLGRARPLRSGEVVPDVAAEPRVMPGSHPLPDLSSAAAASRALSLAGSLGDRDLLLVLVSGGGSALWSAPVGIDLAGKRDLTRVLQRKGADIFELNVVRRHLSAIKGGRLLQATRARVRSLLLSDVPGDSLADIASGPTVPDPSTFEEALEVLRRYDVAVPGASEHLLRGARGEVLETLKPASEGVERGSAEVIGSAAILLEAATSFWTRQGFTVVTISDRLQGEASRLARDHVDLVWALRSGADLRPAVTSMLSDEAQAAALVNALSSWSSSAEAAGPLVLLSGGETTVEVTGSGRGGRNLEFAGWLLHHLAMRSAASGSYADVGLWALSAGTDGVDGSSEAAGAFVGPDSLARANALGIELDDFLRRNDTDTLFSLLDDRLITGPSGNNLNDYRAVIVPRRHEDRLSL